MMTEFEREAQTISKLNHPNIVHYLGLYVDTTPEGQQEKYIVTEYMALGSLDNLLRNNKSITTAEYLSM
jgi:serine/threonine protein kinase